jgi:hypothetical protein
LKSDLTSLDNRLVRRCSVARDQERKLTQDISLILKASNDFGWRCMIAGIDWSCAGVKPGHNSSLSLTASKGFNGMGVLNGGSLPTTTMPPFASLGYSLRKR